MTDWQIAEFVYDLATHKKVLGEGIALHHSCGKALPCMAGLRRTAVAHHPEPLFPFGVKPDFRVRFSKPSFIAPMLCKGVRELPSDKGKDWPMVSLFVKRSS